MRKKEPLPPLLGNTVSLRIRLGLGLLFLLKIKGRGFSTIGRCGFRAGSGIWVYGIFVVATIRSESMKMCRDFKIQSQANKSKAKYEVGTFCTQYDLPPIAPSKRKSKSRKKESLEKPHRRKTSKYYRRKEYNNSKDNEFYKKGKPFKSKTTTKHEKPSIESGK
ncbi:hypothetical protein SO802_004252 [Lithocarpus litseifolius]|uniref:Uncharacterized protein n=1 Tax=Lithocarpus litseifolius TaxID=425828 RepID=A0AAW2E6C8_9ROSI